MSAFYSAARPFRRAIYPYKRRDTHAMGNSKFRCSTCKQYVELSDAYLTMGIGRFCSSECVSVKMNAKKAKARSAAKKAKARAGGTTPKPRTIPLDIRAAVRVRDGQRCRMCGGNGQEVHHIRFRSQGGTDTEDNLILLCNECHHVHAHGELSRYWRQVFRAVIWFQCVEGRRITALDAGRLLARTGVLAAPRELAAAG